MLCEIIWWLRVSMVGYLTWRNAPVNSSLVLPSTGPFRRKNVWMKHSNNIITIRNYNVLWTNTDVNISVAQEAFTPEHVCAFVDKENMTFDTGTVLRFCCHLKPAEEFFFQQKLLITDQFEQVDWSMVNGLRHSSWCTLNVPGVGM